jgi:RNA polymerase sigma-70 factor (ECF subfamily)
VDAPLSEPDDALLVRAVGGDADALAVLLERYGPQVRRSLDGSIPARFQSLLSMDDVMQQAYAEAFTSIRRFVPRGHGAFAAWLAALARCNLLDAVRMLETDKRGGDRRRIESARFPGDDSYFSLLDVVAVTTGTPSRFAARDEGCRAVRAALDRLPEVQRRVVEMYDLQGHAAAEVAAAIGRSEGAMYMLRARAHRALAEHMGSASDFLTSRE